MSSASILSGSSISKRSLFSDSQREWRPDMTLFGASNDGVFPYWGPQLIFLWLLSVSFLLAKTREKLFL
jgi:hypothetical protein